MTIRGLDESTHVLWAATGSDMIVRDHSVPATGSGPFAFMEQVASLL